MSEYIVKIENLSHRYSKSWAIKDINFEINDTGILGLLGSNGAGKSTTMNILCGVLNQTSGKVFINGIDMQQNPREAKKQIGFLPQNPPLHFDLTVDEYLRHSAHMRLISKQEIASAMAEAKERCGVAHFGTRLIRNLSGGYRQRVGIAQAIIHRPKLVVLDEPTNGLDPNQIIEVRKLIKEIATDRAVIFSSHILSEVQVLCKDIKMIEHGKMVFSDTVEAFNNYLSPDTCILKMDKPPRKEVLEAITGVIAIDFITTNEVRVQYNTNNHHITKDLIRQSVSAGWGLKEIYLEKGSMDAVFAQLSKQTVKKIDS
jgi:ABC-2 type transport system ATP-binding protein